MISIYQLKPAFQNLLRPICKRLAAAGVTPNQVTIAALILSLLTGLGLAVLSDSSYALLLLAPVLLLRMALNAIDGMLAREHEMITPLGTFYNELGDLISDVALYLPLALFVGWSGELVVLMVILSLISEMAGMTAVQIGASRRYDGPMGKSDRAFWLGTLGILIGIGLPLGSLLNITLLIINLLLMLTIWRRVSNAIAEAKG